MDALDGKKTKIYNLNTNRYMLGGNKMKRSSVILVIVMLCLMFPISAFALTKGSPGLLDYGYGAGSRAQAKEYSISFRYADHLGNRDTWQVYTAPALNAIRGANGKASLHTSGDVYTGCWSGAWLMVRYQKNNGGFRVGWVPKSGINSIQTVTEWRNANFAYWNVELNSNCVLTDDPLYESEALAYASAGEQLTYLAYYQYNGGREYAYVQGDLDGQPVCGFIPFEAIDW